MKEIIHECIKVQCEYSDIPLQDRIYITFGRIVTEKVYNEEGIAFIIKTIKSEMEFLEEVWNDKKGES